MRKFSLFTISCGECHNLSQTYDKMLLLLDDDKGCWGGNDTHENNSHESLSDTEDDESSYWDGSQDEIMKKIPLIVFRNYKDDDSVSYLKNSTDSKNFSFPPLIAKNLFLKTKTSFDAARKKMMNKSQRRQKQQQQQQQDKSSYRRIRTTRSEAATAGGIIESSPSILPTITNDTTISSTNKKSKFQLARKIKKCLSLSNNDDHHY